MPLLESPEILRSILETMHTGVYFVGRDQRIQFWNEGAERITGYLRQDVVGHFCRDFFPATGAEELAGYCEIGGALAEVLRDGKATCSDVSIRHRAGHQVLLRVWAAPIRGSEGTIVGAAEGFEEDRWSLDSDRRHRKLEEYSCMDETEEVLSRAYLRTILRQQLMAFAEHHLPFSVLGVKLNRISELRSQYGPAAIREILRVVARTMITNLRPTNSLGRLDDDTFLGVLPECNALEADRLGMRLQAVAGNMQVKWWGDNFPVTATLAIATAERDDTMEVLIRRAETRLAEKTRAGELQAK
jgi:PAS domain S-box-containing protein/diguanylate cyclase (GGDEF)-like protein